MLLWLAFLDGTYDLVARYLGDYAYLRQSTAGKLLPIHGGLGLSVSSL